MTQTIDIKGKPYVTVAGRVEEAHKANKTLSITTELVPADVVLFKATVVTEKGTFTGYSAANPAKAIEKMTPHEVAETSAVGRALGFAGYGIAEGIATAEEIHKAQPNPTAISSRATSDQVSMILKELKRTGVDKDKIYKTFNVTDLTDLTKAEAEKVITKLVAKVVTVNS